MSPKLYEKIFDIGVSAFIGIVLIVVLHNVISDLISTSNLPPELIYVLYAILFMFAYGVYEAIKKAF